MNTRARAITRAIVRANKAVAAAAPSSPIDTPEAIALAGRFQELRREGMRTLVDLAVSLGQILIEAKRALKGSYHVWLRERLGLEQSTARNYVAMGQLAREAPAVVERHKELGAAKLYQVARLLPEARHEVLARRDLPQLNDRQFHAVVAPHRTRSRKVTGNMRAHGLRLKIQSYTRTITAARPGRITDDETLAALKRDLAALQGAVETLAARLR